MSAAAGRTAGKVGQAIKGAATKANNAANEAGTGKGNQSVLQKGAKRDPELYILLTIMTGAFGMAGYYFGRKPTASSSEAPVSMAQESMPWQTTSKGDGADEHFKYQYHPGGDKNKTPKDAPSALHSVIVPNVTLPKKLHDQFNKYGKDGF
ncbi:hypothetical protein OEA41_006117 [Lepraria neglecta]|uniref:Uncharacterized protein n=1 Tax=Lepraria neglecta TaxID=209136 RepID=A0AAD9ZAL9_9LECA|nr:hypothetical protein OEA41_006117 [Lepraria neglecta]